MAKKPKFGHEKFVEYTKAIVEDPAFAGMPDVLGKKNSIQWEAPSNRSGGQFQYTHRDRLAWWKAKAKSIGINSDENNWISRTAKTIHPTKKKPCKNCGAELYIAYRYPKKTLADRIKKLPFVPPVFEVSPIEDICDLVDRMHASFGDQVFSALPKILLTSSISVPEISPTVEAWKEYLLKDYIPHEPATLSPGAMSNAPDRLDGFHSFNRCCRGTSDKGRTKENLQTYSTDRRTFEYWVDGDWIAADRLMAIVKSDKTIKSQPCFNFATPGKHPVPCQADHIGPISLGFCHRPHFQLLCKSCNSAKNNRMYASDIATLLKEESSGETVVSWWAKDIWDARKGSATNGDLALRLSKMMRDNRHTYMAVLRSIFDGGHLTYLASLLALECADRIPKFEGLQISGHLTKYSDLVFYRRTSKYAEEQKARRIRVAFQALSAYHKKQNRNACIISCPESEALISSAKEHLESAKVWTNSLDEELAGLFLEEQIAEEDLRRIVEKLPQTLKDAADAFEKVTMCLKEALKATASQLSLQWENDRYLRVVPNEMID